MLGLGAAIGLVLVIAVGLWAPPVATPTTPIASVPRLPAASSAAPPAVDGMAVEDVYRRFESGGAASAGGRAVQLSTERAGVLEFLTGRVVASDAYYLADDLPFTRWLAAGRHQVFVLHAMSASPRDDRVAAALIRARPGNPVRWEMALRPRQDVTVLGPHEFFGYDVESGTGSFASSEASEWLSRAGATAYAVYEKRIEAAMFPSQGQLDHVVDIPLGDPRGLNVIVFHSGWGDGSYPSYFGLDDSGRPVVLMTDFQILDAS